MHKLNGGRFSWLWRHKADCDIFSYSRTNDGHKRIIDCKHLHHVKSSCTYCITKLWKFASESINLHTTVAWAVKRMIFWTSFWGVPRGVAPKNCGKQNRVCSSTILHKNQISMFCGLEKERKRFRKKKKRKKTHRGQKWVGSDKRVSTCNSVKYFLPYLSWFQMRSLFSSKLSGRFWVLKPNSPN